MNEKIQSEQRLMSLIGYDCGSFFPEIYLVFCGR